jgi:hypothetical protein
MIRHTAQADRGAGDRADGLLVVGLCRVVLCLGRQLRGPSGRAAEFGVEHGGGLLSGQGERRIYHRPVLGAGEG